VNPGFEIAGPFGTDVTGWFALNYGTEGTVFERCALAGTALENGETNGVGFLWTDCLLLNPDDDATSSSSSRRDEIAFRQEDASEQPVGLALVTGAGDVVQFVCYGNSGLRMVAVEGAASGFECDPIGIGTPPNGVDDDTISLIGSGLVFEDFTWRIQGRTEDALNEAQAIEDSPTPTPTLSEGVCRCFVLEDRSCEVLQTDPLTGTQCTSETLPCEPCYCASNGTETCMTEVVTGYVFTVMPFCELQEFTVARCPL